MRQETLEFMMQYGAPVDELIADMATLTDAAIHGEFDVDTMDAIVNSLDASPEVAEKATVVLSQFVESVMEGQRLDQSIDPVAAAGTLALCNTCPTAQPIPAATTSCQFISGNTISSCQSDFYRVDLPANSSCFFTTCPSEACGAGANATYDTFLRLRRPGACNQVAFNDDVSCSQIFRSRVDYSTGDAPETIILEVEGFSTQFGSYNLGYSCVESCTIEGTLGVPQPDKATWQVPGRMGRFFPSSTCANNKSCPGPWSTGSSTRAYDRWDFEAGANPECITVDLNIWNSGYNPGCFPTFAHPVAVTGSFPAGQNFSCNPAPGVTYLGDSGASPTSIRRPFSFNLPANTPWSLVVFGANNSNTGCEYDVTVSPCNVTPPSECAPQLVSLNPSTGSAGANCDSIENFTVNFQHDRWIPPVRLDWTITPPAGGSASPAGGTLNIPAGVDSVNIPEAVSFIRANCPASGVFDIDMVVTNNCDPPEEFSERTFRYTLNDDTPPVFGPQQDICLWPPNHELLCQDSLDIRSTTDNCGPEGIVMGAEACDSDQDDNGLGDGNTEGDCEIDIDDVGGQQIVCTRAERSGTIGSGNEGRTYTITGRARDACGNFTPSTTLQVVSVPHDQREHPECISP